MRELRPGAQLAGYRIEAVERADTDAAVLLAHDPTEGREVTLHVAGEPPGALSTTRFMERARRLRAVEHPHLLDVYGARTLDGRCVAVAQAPPGRRLDQLRPSPEQSVRIVRQIASAVDALEDAGAELPPLIRERIWVDEHGDARLDGLVARTAVSLPGSSSAALALLLEALHPRSSAALQTVLERARDGAYLSAGQLASELRRAESASERRRRTTSVTLAVAAAVLALIVLLLLL